MSRGLTIVISAPSGGGKGTILKELFLRDENLRYSVSATTRAPRPGEKHGEQYYFVSREEFTHMIEHGEMLEHAEFCDNLYGTPRKPVEEQTEKGFDVVLEIEVQGGAQIKRLVPDCVSIFIVPPSMEVLEKRLRRRGTEQEDVVLKRLATARKEIPMACNYDYVVVNGELEKAVDEVEAILRAEKLRYKRRKEWIDSMLVK